MKNSLFTFFALLSFVIIAAPARAVGWPENFEGVMLQSFWWDSYQTETTWKKLEKRADELSPYFRLIWVPQSGQSTGGLGYMPIFWFTNHNSSMGSESELLSMIKTYKSRGTGIIADVVVNHRAGQYNWADFPYETWNGTTWHIGKDGICRTDEINNAGNPGGATGAADTGDDFNGARDLDHTNANVQNNCKNYMKCLLEKYGYEGYRLDMVKGFSGKYVKTYNQYAKPTFSVGEYWDGYDNIAAWIEATGWESAAFDFPFKYAVNEAFASGDMSKLVWLENGTTPKPAGMIHHWYTRMAVTFLDNHDTYRDDWNRFNGNWAAANAFMICSPGTPCVFMPHWNACGDQIARMIAARNSVGITNTSEVRVIEYSKDCYMAELTGTRGRLAVKIGPAMATPPGWNDSQIACTGEDYCIWTDDGLPRNLYVIGNLPRGDWKTNYGIPLVKGDDGVYTATAVELGTGGADAYFSLTTTLASDWSELNKSDRYGAISDGTRITPGTPATVKKYDGGSTASSTVAWKIKAGCYTLRVDLRNLTVTATTPTQEDFEAMAPDHLYIIGNLEKTSWATNTGIEMEREGTVYTAREVVFKPVSGQTDAYFSLATTLGADWDAVNAADRYGAESADMPLAPGQEASTVLFASGVNAAASNAWKIAGGTYNVRADLARRVIAVQEIDQTLLNNVWVDGVDAPRYYTLQGIEVKDPVPGTLMIVRRGAAVAKEYIK